MRTKVLIGVSGGVDSAVSVYILKKKGFEVIPVFFEFFDQSPAVYDNLKLLEKNLDITVLTYNLKKEFRDKVVRPFFKMHHEGVTPSPCTVCNRKMKWKYLQDIACEFKIPFIATGHYVGTIINSGQKYIRQGTDSTKDQSYYLWDIPAEVIPKMVFPLEEHEKAVVKEMAKEIGLTSLSVQKESSGVCFLNGKSFTAHYEQFYPGHLYKLENGIVQNTKGENVGTHQGYPLYTIGQQKNIMHGLEGKWAVKKIDAANNRLIVDKPKNLLSRQFKIHRVNFINENEILQGDNISVKVRGLGLNPDGFANIVKQKHGEYLVETEHPAWAPCPGQPAVFYCHNRLLGGGIIKEVDFMR